MGKPALLIIDMQNDFVAEGKPAESCRGTGGNPEDPDPCSLSSGNCPSRSSLSCGSTGPDGSDVEITRQDLFRKSPFAVEGTTGAAVIDELAPRPGEYIIPKIRMSAFIGTELDLMLRTLGITRLFVCGIQTPNCIRTTVFDGIAYNYPVVLIDDATGASSEDVHRANVRDMQNIGVRIVKAAEIPGILG